MMGDDFWMVHCGWAFAALFVGMVIGSTLRDR